MTIPAKLTDYLNQRRASFDVFQHPHSSSSAQTARQMHVPAEKLAKSVLLEDDGGYLMAVLPASGRVHIGALSKQLNRRLRLATEAEVVRLFDGCEPGAVPALGTVWGVETLIEDSLMQQPDVYFEAGDHTELIHMSVQQFMQLMAGVPHCHFMVRD